MIFYKIILDETMTKENTDKFDSMPFFALIHHISKNRLKYSMKNPNRIDMVHEGRYLMEIHNRENLSQDDLAGIFGQSKGTIAKALRKLEDKGYVERQIDENNRRKYILKTTEKGEELAILLKNDLNEWEKTVGIDKLDDKTKNQLRQIARKSEEILEE
jgi:DNA-binding MarR family transcriptional regulator